MNCSRMTIKRLLVVIGVLTAGLPAVAQDVDEAPIGEAVEKHMSGDGPTMQWMQDPERVSRSRQATRSRLARCSPTSSRRSSSPTW